MPPTSPAARALAHRLLGQAGALAGSESGGSEAPNAADPVAALEWVCRHLGDELSRWFGPYGFHALLTRALAKARVDQPPLAAVRVRSSPDAYLDGLGDAVQGYGVHPATEAFAALLAAFIDLLGRLIGEDLAVNLVSQATMLSAPDVDDPSRPGVDVPPSTRASDVESGS